MTVTCISLVSWWWHKVSIQRMWCYFCRFPYHFIISLFVHSANCIVNFCDVTRAAVCIVLHAVCCVTCHERCSIAFFFAPRCQPVSWARSSWTIKCDSAVSALRTCSKQIFDYISIFCIITLQFCRLIIKYSHLFLRDSWKCSQWLTKRIPCVAVN